jgi:hypothetical protein
MKKLSLMLACAGIISAAAFGNNHVSHKQSDKTKKTEAVQKDKTAQEHKKTKKEITPKTEVKPAPKTDKK